MGRFGLSQPVRRSEDHRFLTGSGRYTADISLPGQAYAMVLRSPHAHAVLRHIDAAAALALPGVRAVVTAADLAADGLSTIRCAVPVKGPVGQPMPSPGRPLLARDRVRFVGEPVAFVVAESVAAAQDAAESIDVGYEPLPAVAGIEEALQGDSRGWIWDGAADNIAFFWERGDEAKVDAALRHAVSRIDLQLVHNRVIPCPMETRAAIGAYNSEDHRFTLYTSSQGGHAIKEQLARDTLKVPAERIRVIVPDVGGGFGSKIFHYPEEALVLWCSQRLGRPVKWVADRSEAFLGDTHGRDQRNSIAAAFTADGRIEALRVDTVANMGAYLNEFAPAIPSQMTGCMLSGAYAVPLIYASCRGVYTNSTPVDAYRGAGRPEATYIVERLMQEAARKLGLPPDELRRRNFIRPEQMPYRTAAGPVYDSGDFARNLDDALRAADWAGFERRRIDASARGRLRGRGLACYVEICGFDEEEATLRCGADGSVELLIGTQSTGQGHETAYAQIVADDLGVPFEQITVRQGDTDRIPFGRGTSGSRSLPVGGPAVRAACAALIAHGETLARHLLQAGDRPMRFDGGRYSLEAEAGGRSIALAEIATALAAPENRPAGVQEAQLTASGRFKLEASTFPNGTHVCEVEVDPDTGQAEVVSYHVVDDFGTVVNPLLLAGQVYGGIAQGIGQALFENAVYDRDSAQLLTGSFVDYGLPRAADVPFIDFRTNTVPCTTNPMGIKGAGEAGTIGACPAVVNAVLDALAPLGVGPVDMPLTPERIWRAIGDANAAAPRPASS
ncbi:MAG TPA: xanthine dehydrogenase family protein molybdopterin-binding subunit [Rhodospirillales bacterium]|nr:xanthine dehydrogenase family protein molybdopterin-binding subunit [Rhodospirillales bacterium]